MAITVNIYQANTELSCLVARALAGEEIITARAGRPAVRLVPVRQLRVPGSARGEVRFAPDFDAPLPEEVLKAFEGKAE